MLARQQRQTRGDGAAAPSSAPSQQTGSSNAQALEQQPPTAAGSETPVLDEVAPATPLHEVREQITETISNAPEPYGAWNGLFGWESRFALQIDNVGQTVTIVSRIQTGADEATRQRWEEAIESKWGGRYALVVAPEAEDGAEERYEILCDLQWVTSMEDPHYTVAANSTSATEGGRAGLGGTTSMTAWGTEDTVDVAHEFGHMLGAVEDYFTTNGEDHTEGGARTGFRDADGGIMNNPADDPFTEHYELVRRHAARALGVDESRCSVV